MLTWIKQLSVHTTQAILCCLSLSASQDVGQRWSFSIGGRAPRVFTTGPYPHFELQGLANLHRFGCKADLERYLLIGAATSMGAVAIWCMHYVGNCAIQILNGEQELQLEYRRSYTAGSFFLPICVLGLAFYYFNQSRAISLQEPILGGIVTGLAVLGMHYTAEIGISNYTISFSWKYILGSAAVAVAANIAALGVFFYVTKVWTNGLLKKLFCASLLAISVSGMHWVATVGTTYRFEKRSSSTRNDLSRQGAAVVVVCLVRFSYLIYVQAPEKFRE